MSDATPSASVLPQFASSSWWVGLPREEFIREIERRAADGVLIDKTSYRLGGVPIPLPMDYIHPGGRNRVRTMWGEVA